MARQNGVVFCFFSSSQKSHFSPQAEKKNPPKFRRNVSSSLRRTISPVEIREFDLLVGGRGARKKGGQVELGMDVDKLTKSGRNSIGNNNNSGMDEEVGRGTRRKHLRRAANFYRHNMKKDPPREGDSAAFPCDSIRTKKKKNESSWEPFIFISKRPTRCHSVGEERKKEKDSSCNL